jgi:hypothetical protein
MCLTILIQLNIISTRNPSFWWHFSPTTAPAPAALLVVPVFLFLLAATFVAVYWPPRVKPDGGLGFMDGPGWSVILLVWFYSLLWWSASDVAKTVVQKVFRQHDVIKERAKISLEALPLWVRVLDAPAQLTVSVKQRVEQLRQGRNRPADVENPPQS